MSDDKRSYKVGYGRPPQSGKFRQGQSGNPKGRPKGSRNLATIVLAESREKVRIQGPKGPRTISKLHAAVMQLQNKAAQGHLPSQREFFALVQMSEDAQRNADAPGVVPEVDQVMMKSLLRRMREVNDDTAANQVETDKGGEG